MYGLEQRENTNTSSYKEFSLPHFIPSPLLGLGLLKVPSTEHLLSTRFWMSSSDIRKIRVHNLFRMHGGVKQTRKGKEKWTGGKLPVDGLFLLYLLCSGFSPII